MTKKNQETTARADQSANAPVESFRVDDISCSIFQREYNRKAFHSITFSRSYRDSASGKRLFTKSFDREDLGKVVTVAKQAAAYLEGLEQ